MPYRATSGLVRGSLENSRVLCHCPGRGKIRICSPAESSMSTICRLVQGSAEWPEHRRKYRNASETPIVLGLSPWMTPYQLRAHKLGLTEPVVTPAMLRGTELEPAARAAYEALTGHVPYHAETPAAVMLAQMQSPLPAARSVNPSVPAAVDS